MMKTHPRRNVLVGDKKKAMPLVALAFFLCLTNLTNAQVNSADGDFSVYGNVANLSTISSSDDGSSNLDVLNPVTTQILLDNLITGYINVSNNFSSMRINGSTTAELTGEETATLSIYGGTNLSLTGGTYTGGEKKVLANDWKGGIGGIISGVQTVQVSSVKFTGGMVNIIDYNTGGGPPIPGQTNQTPVAQGADALHVIDSYILLIDSPTIQGGNAGDADSTQQDAFASGGMGISLLNSSSTISNGTFRGGNGGTATASSGLNAFADGGHAVYASNSVIEIHAGTYTGGAAGSANGETTTGGAGLIAVDGSSITNHGGTFSGSSGAPSVALRNSDFTAFGGQYTSGGLYSETVGTGTNNVSLTGGTFSSLNFINSSTNGIQFVTEGSNLVVTTDIFQNGGTVTIDNLASNSAFQRLTILDGSMVFSNDVSLASGGFLTLSNANSSAFFQGLELQSNSKLDLGLGQVTTAGALQVNDGATLKFQIITNQYGTLTTTGQATFESNSTVIVDATLAGFSSGTITNTLILTGGSIIGDFTNGVITDVQTTLDTNMVGRTTYEEMLVNNNLAFVFNTSTLSNYWNATGQMADLADELEIIDNSVMNAIINNMGATASQAAVEETYFTTLNTMQTAMQGLNAAVGQAISRGTEFRDERNLPKGAKGPDEAENDVRFWAKYYGQFYTHSQDAENAAYESTLHGGVIGVDKSFGALLIGLSGGMGNYRIESDNDSQEDLNAAHGALYTTIGKEHSFLDAGVAYGYNKVESQTGGPFVLNGDFDTHLLSGYIGGGIGFPITKISTVITPEASIQYSTYQQDAYTETSTTAAPRSFDEFDADSLRSSLGLNVAMLNTKALDTFGFKIEGRAHWLREFNPDPGTLTFQLESQINDYQIAYPLLDEDIFRVGVGFSFFNTARGTPHNIMLRLDFDELFGQDFNSHNLAAKAIFAF